MRNLIFYLILIFSALVVITETQANNYLTYPNAHVHVIVQNNTGITYHCYPSDIMPPVGKWTVGNEFIIKGGQTSYDGYNEGAQCMRLFLECYKDPNSQPMYFQQGNGFCVDNSGKIDKDTEGCMTVYSDGLSCTKQFNPNTNLEVLNIKWLTNK